MSLQPPNVFDPTSADKGSVVQKIIVIGLILLGIQIWLITDPATYRPFAELKWYLLAVGLSFVPWVQQGVERIRGWLDHRSVLATGAIACAVAIGSIFVLYTTAVASDRQFTPAIHDEFSYLIQTQMLANGRLWMTAHPIGDFFDTFYVITDRVYASQYFPGAAAMFVPGVWLGLVSWVMPLVITGAAMAMLFLVLRELFDGVVGLAGVIAALGNQTFRFVSLLSLAQMPALLLMLISFYAILRWDRSRRMSWIIFTGGVMGWLAVTRPLDAVVTGIAIAAFVAWRLRRESWFTWGRTAGGGLLPMLPFLLVQLILNVGVTSQLLETPFGYYARRDMPDTSLGFHDYDPAHRPVSPLPQKQAFFDSQVAPMIKQHTPSSVFERWVEKRWRYVLSETLPDMLFVIAVPLGIIGVLRQARLVMVASVTLLWCVAYSLHTFTYFHYYVFVIPSILILVFAGWRQLDRLGGVAARARPALTLLTTSTVCVLMFPQFKRDIVDQVVTNMAEVGLRTAIERIESPAIVLVRYGVGAHPEEEVVYNVDVAWPDDARVVRAHDLGDQRNLELFDYYATHQPERIVYRFDRPENVMVQLGNVRELASLAETREPSIMRTRQGSGHDTNGTPTGAMDR